MDWHFTARILSIKCVGINFYERMNHLWVYKRLLTNRLHGKAAELELANS